MRMEQYLTHIDYALWEVTVNGDAPYVVALASTGAEGPIPLKTAKQKLARKNELKAKNQEGLDKTYDRFQKLISQLEIHGEVISQEDANLKLLRSLPLAWNNIALIMRNKFDLDTLSMDDLYNNLKVYESEIKGKSSSSSNSQNVAFVSLDNSSNTNEIVNTTHSVFATSSKDQASIASYANDVMFSFFANQSNAPQLDYEDLEQIDANDLEEMDLKWQVTMLTMRVKRDRAGAPRNQGNRNRDAPRRNAPVDTSTTNALVVQDGIGKSLQEHSTSISTARPVNIVAPKPKVNDALPTTYSYFKAHSSVRRAFNQKPAAKTNNFNEKVNTARVNNVTTTEPKAVVSAAKGNRENVVKSSACWIWRPTGNVIDHTSKDNGSYMLKRFNYVDQQGRLKSVMAWVPKRTNPLTLSSSTAGTKVTAAGLQLLEELLLNGPNWLFDIDALTISMNYKPIVAGNQTNGNVGTKENIDACQARKKIVPNQEYILLPLLTSDLSLSKSSKDSPDVRFKPSGEEEKIDSEHQENEDSEVSNTEEPRVNQEQDANVNSTNNINTVSPTVSDAYIENNVVDENIVYGCIDDSNMPNLEEIVYSGDDEEVDAEADMNNLATNVPVSPIPTTRVHKDHPLKQIIGDLHSAPQTRRVTKNLTEHENRFRRGTIDKTLFIKKDKGDILLVQVYVDDIIFGSTKKSLCVEFEQMMHKRFQMSSMGELTFFLGLQVKQKDDGNFISQDKYVVDILKKFDFATVKTASTLIETNKALLKDEEAEDVDVHLYRSMIGSLMYLTASRPDIMFVVCACARFQVTPKVSHLHAVKRIFRYLKGQPKLGLWYPRDSPFDLEAFSDSDYAGASLDRKSTTGEYVAAANCCGQVLWVQNQMLDYGFNFMNTKIYIDNESTICIVKNPVFHSKTKHIEIRHHFIRDSYEKKLIQVIKIHTDHNVADLLTKAFDVSRRIVIDETVIKEWEDRMERAANVLLHSLEERRTIQVLIDKKKVVITEKSVRSDLMLDDAEGTECLSNDVIFKQLTLMSAKTTACNEFSSTMASAIICLTTNQNFNFSKYIFDNMMKNLEGGVKFLMYPRFVQVFLYKQVEGMSKHEGIYVTPSHTKKIFANIKREGKGFSGRITPLFQTMIVQATEDIGEDSAAPTDSHSTPIITQPSSSKPQKKKSRRKQRKDSGPTESIPDEAANEEPIYTPFL
ncbi:putative ribonuclease H-like domain-containing protein [Tanacetum coccineum]